MSQRRSILDFPRNEAGLVDEFIGTAFDAVYALYLNLDELLLADSYAAAALASELAAKASELAAELAESNAKASEIAAAQAVVDTANSVLEAIAARDLSEASAIMALSYLELSQAAVITVNGDRVLVEQLAQETQEYADQVGPIRADFANQTDPTKGANLVAWDGDHVSDQMNLGKKLANYSTLRAYKGLATVADLVQVGIAGRFYRDDADTISPDDGFKVIIDVMGRRWKRIFNADIQFDWVETKTASGLVTTGTTGVPVQLSKLSLIIGAIQPTTEFNVRGFGRSTILTRSSNSDFVKAWSAPLTIKSLVLDLKRSTNGYSGHGITVDGQDADIQDVTVKDFGSDGVAGGTGVLHAVVPGSEMRARFKDLTIIGDPLATLSFGWIFVNTRASFASGIYACDIVGYAHELKNDARYNNLYALIAERSNWALAYGQETTEIDGADFNSATGIVGRACDGGLLIGEGSYNLVSGLVHDQDGAPGREAQPNAARFILSARGNAVFGLLSHGAGLESTVYYSGFNNYVQVAAHDTSALVVKIASGSTGNATEIVHPGARTSILSSISDLSGSPIDGATANPVWCPATGERVGSISGGFHDRLGTTGALFNTNHRWKKERKINAIEAFATEGLSGDLAGFAYSTPTSSTQGTLYYAKGSSDANDFWSFGVGNTNTAYRVSTTSFGPGADNIRSLGTASLRFSTVYAGAGTINTSDERAKQQVSEIPEDVLDAWASVQFHQYKFNESVDAKGTSARWHFGVIAQQIKAAFEAAGLDALEYGLLCYDEWGDQLEVRAENGDIIQAYIPAGNRYGVRYEEALVLESALMRRATRKLEARLAVLESLA